MSMHRLIVPLSFAVCAGSVCPVSGQCSGTETQKITSSDGAAWDLFGYAVHARGDRAIVGARTKGAAYLFRDQGGLWVEQQKLQVGGGGFGDAVCIDGDLAVIGASTDDDAGSSAGAAYVYRFNGTQWVQEQKLFSSDAEDSDFFGNAVAVSGGVVLVGARFGNGRYDDTGAAYVFRHDGTAWVEEQKLWSADGQLWDWFGWTVALDGNVAVIGANADKHLSVMSGTASVFRYDGVQWLEEQKLYPMDGTSGDGFGRWVSIDGDVVVVGAWKVDDQGANAGAAYVFRHDGTSWVEEEKLLALDGAAGDQFGVATAVDGDLIVVGAHLHDDQNTESGAAYAFRHNGNHWVEVQKLRTSDGWKEDWYGHAITVRGDDVLVGSRRDDDRGKESGSCYVFRLSALALDASPEQVSPFDPMTITTCGGLNGGLVMLTVVDVSGSPVFYRLAIDSFDLGGRWALPGTVPPGLSGLTADLLSLGQIQLGHHGLSNVETVVFQ